MSPARRPKKRSSSKPKPRKVTPKRRRSPAKRKPAKKKRSPAKRSQKQKRSAAAKKGWATRRKKARLLNAMVDLKMKRAAETLPLGWVERREKLRYNNGKLWRQISISYDESIVHARRLETLAELEIDMLNRDDLRDYLEWVADIDDLDISDVYRMYLGYPLEASLTA
jgi:hypothetical protein